MNTDPQTIAPIYLCLEAVFHTFPVYRGCLLVQMCPSRTKNPTYLSCWIWGGSIIYPHRNLIACYCPKLGDLCFPVLLVLEPPLAEAP